MARWWRWRCSSSGSRDEKLLKRALFAVAAALLIYQIATVGLANNGDFPRIAGRLSLCPEGGWGANRFTYFVSRYTESAACHWDSEVPSSGMPVFWAARLLEHGPHFQIRFVGFLQAAILLALLWFRPWVGLILLDISYIAYFNSFYLEGVSWLFLLCTVAAALRRDARWFALAALLLVTSKLQHAYLALPLAVYAVCVLRARLWAIGTAAALLIAGVWMNIATPLDYKASNLWDSVFVTLLPADPGALGSFHAPAQYAAWIGRSAYQFPDQATADTYVRGFYIRSGYGPLLRYYATHPMRAARRAWDGAAQLHFTRPAYLGIYERGSRRWPVYSWWSDLKSAVYLHAPWLAALLFAASLGLLWRSPNRPLLVLLLAMAALEFVSSCFGDGIFDYRHNFLFHAITDIWVCFTLAEMTRRVLPSLYNVDIHASANLRASP